MKRSRTNPHAAKKAKTPASPSAHCQTSEPQHRPRGGARRLLRFLLGREIPARIVEAGGEGVAPRSGRRRPRGQARPLSEGELLRDLPLDQRIAADRRQERDRERRELARPGPREAASSPIPSPPGEGARRAGEGPRLRQGNSPVKEGRHHCTADDEEDRRGGDQDLRTRQESQAGHEPAGHRRVPSPGMQGHLAQAERRDEAEERQAVAERVVPDLARQGEQDVDEHREGGDPLVEEDAGQAEEGEEQGDRGDRGDRLGRDPPGLGPFAQEGRDQRFGERDERGVERVLVGPPDDVDPGPRLELAGDPDELQAVLRGEDRPRHPDRVQRGGEQDDRDEEPPASHRDPPCIDPPTRRDPSAAGRIIRARPTRSMATEGVPSPHPKGPQGFAPTRFPDASPCAS